MLLTAEGAFVDRGAIPLERVETALRSKDFARLITRFEGDLGGSRDAQDLTHTYRRLIVEQLGGSAHLTGFACGTSICVGSIRTSGGNDAYVRWSDLFFESKATPNYVFTEMSIALDNRTFENRFFFSTDPGVAGASSRR